jgi:hypothetical protein
MKRFLLIILTGTIYCVGISICHAGDDAIANYDAQLKAINEELDKIEGARNNQITSSGSPIVPRKNTIEFSSETYWAKFDEPKNFSQKGFMSGYNAQYARRFSTDPNSIVNMFALQAQWASGKFKQAPYVGPSGIKDNTFEFRGVVGKDLYPTSFLRTTPYIGYGYRYLKDNSAGLTADVDGFTLLGYKRYSHYNYIPIGTDIVYQIDPLYSLESSLEYEYMFNGWQVDKLGIIPGLNTFSFDQRSGNGLRASLRLNLYFKYCTAFAEGFYRYWRIAQSNSKPIPGDPGVSIDEPKDNTQEFGFRLGLQV